MIAAKFLQAIQAMANALLLPEQIEMHAAALSAAFAEYGIDTPNRACAALAQFAHETGGWRWLRERGGAGYFRRYDGRDDLGNTQPGDGARFCGRGYIQITGRANYARATRWFPALELLDHPERAEEPRNAAMISSCWWQENGLNELADARRIKDITIRINGGLNGYAKRKERFTALLKLVGESERQG